MQQQQRSERLQRAGDARRKRRSQEKEGCAEQSRLSRCELPDLAVVAAVLLVKEVVEECGTLKCSRRALAQTVPLSVCLPAAAGCFVRLPVRLSGPPVR